MTRPQSFGKSRPAGGDGTDIGAYELQPDIPHKIEIELTETEIDADETFIFDALVWVYDANDKKVAELPVEVSSSDPEQQVGSVEDEEGLYSAKIKASGTPGLVTITARVPGTKPLLSASATIRQVNPSPPKEVELTLVPGTVEADGTATATATVTGENGKPSPFREVEITSSDSEQTVEGFTDRGDGTYLATIKPGGKAGEAMITAKVLDGAGEIADSAPLKTVPAAPAQVKVVIEPNAIPAGGTTTATAIATVEDAFGNPVPGQSVVFGSSDPDQHFGSVTDKGDGTYEVQIDPSPTAGKATITATAGGGAGAVLGTATLEQTVGPPASMQIQLEKKSIVADGESTNTATATVIDADGIRVPGATVAFTASNGQPFGPVDDNGDGTYTALVTAGKQLNPTVSVKATVSSVSPSLSVEASYAEVAGPPERMEMRLEPASLPADGASTSTAKVSVSDRTGNPITGLPVTIVTDGDQPIGPVADRGGGTYTAIVTSSAKAGSSQITARLVTGDVDLAVGAQLVQTIPPPPPSPSPGPPPSPGEGPPRITKLRLRGSHLSVTLSEAARVRFVVNRPARGHRRWVTMPGSFAINAKQGTTTTTFHRKLSGRALASGRYRLVAVATDTTGLASAPRAVRFTVPSR
jgi:hypothetical protein